MQSVVAFVRTFLDEEDGLAVTEYGLLLALVAVALVVIVKTFGGQLASFFSDNSDKVTTATSGP
jgi:pilus assembly protein Flp/PilA